MQRGEIWHLNFDPAAGRELKGPHFGLVVSTEAFNRLGVPLVCPISTTGSQARFAGFAVSLMGAGTSTTGVIMCNQIKALDLKGRGGRFVERVPRQIVDEVLAILQAILE